MQRFGGADVPQSVGNGPTPRPSWSLRRTAWRIVHRVRTLYQTLTSRVNACPILVTGNQKSGTTAIAALLAEMTGASVSLDLKKEMPSPTFHRVRSGDLSIDAFVRRNRLDFSRHIIKEPNFVVLYDALLHRFPESTWVFIVRDPRDNIRSILNRLRLPGNLHDLDRPYCGLFQQAWNLYLDGRWLGIENGNYIDVLASRWKLAADLYLQHRRTMILVRYEDFEKAKIEQIENLAHRLGLEPRHDITDHLDVAYQPPGDRTVAWREFFGADNLSRIERACRPAMEQLGYA